MCSRIIQTQRRASGPERRSGSQSWTSANNLAPIPPLSSNLRELGPSCEMGATGGVCAAPALIATNPTGTKPAALAGAASIGATGLPTKRSCVPNAEALPTQTESRSPIIGAINQDSSTSPPTNVIVLSRKRIARPKVVLQPTIHHNLLAQTPTSTCSSMTVQSASLERDNVSSATNMEEGPCVRQRRRDQPATKLKI